MLRAFCAGPYAMMGNNMVGTRGHRPPRHPHRSPRHPHVLCGPEAAHRRLAGADARRPGREPAGVGGGQISAPPGEAEAEAEAGGRRCRPRGCVLGAKPRLLTQLASYDAARNIWQALLHGAVDGCLHRRAYYQRPGALRQGLTLVHFSAQLEPCLTHTHTGHTINTP